MLRINFRMNIKQKKTDTNLHGAWVLLYEVYKQFKKKKKFLDI